MHLDYRRTAEGPHSIRASRGLLRDDLWKVSADESRGWRVDAAGQGKRMNADPLSSPRTLEGGANDCS